MEIKTIEPFLDYFEKIRERTLRVASCIPPDKIDWTYHAGKFTFADIIRHLATIERYMYAENVQGKPSLYPGHGPELADGYDGVLEFMSRMHNEAMEIFRRLTPEDLERKCTTPGGAEIATWKWLRAMIEHEVHHRGQLYLYLGLLEVPTPPIYGLTSEEVRARSRKAESSMKTHEPQTARFEERVRESFARQGLMRTINARLTRVAPGEVSIELPFHEDFTQQHGYMHAGIVTSIADTACGYAAFTLMPEDAEVLSVEYKINLLAPARGEKLVARAVVKRAGRTLSVCYGEVFAVTNNEEKIVATMLATMMAIRGRAIKRPKACKAAVYECRRNRHAFAASCGENTRRDYNGDEKTKSVPQAPSRSERT